VSGSGSIGKVGFGLLFVRSRSLKELLLNYLAIFSLQPRSKIRSQVALHILFRLDYSDFICLDALLLGQLGPVDLNLLNWK
jgi:hypothetical protein